MGKSPGKWIKTLIFGKKSSRSKYPKPNHEKSEDVKEEPVSIHQIGNSNLALSVSQRSHEENIDDNPHYNNSQDEVKAQVATNLNLSAAPTPELYAPNDSDSGRIRQEQAAIDLQAAVRGYLARRAFSSLKGIIRLQALIRGHLVRRQAISTLYCMFQIVKFQARARGINIRHSDIGGVEVQNKHTRVNHQVICSAGVNKSTDILKRSINGFARKIVASSPAAMPLHFQYDSNETNSVLRWLERWSTSRCWKLIPKPNAGQQSEVKKPHTHTCKSSVTNVEGLASEYDKTTRILRKVSYIEPANIVEENPEVVLERVKRSLRKVNNPVLETTFLAEPETSKKITNDNARKIITEPEKVSESKVEKEVIWEIEKTEENVNVMKKSRRRVAVPTQQELRENNEQKPKIKRSTPSYMASTVSAKAKLRVQDSPETPTTITRRHSLPSLKNANTSLSPRVQSTGRFKNDRSLQLSRDSNGSVKVCQAEWRR